MTATDELRRLLDERGVEWFESVTRKGLTWIYRDGKAIRFHPWQPDTLKVSMFDLTTAQAIAATLGAGTCESDETDLIPFVRADSGDLEVDYIHVMECSACGGTYEHVSGSYEFCPRCGARIVEVDE